MPSLPDEILLMIMSKISNLHALNSFVRVNKKLDRLAYDFVHNPAITLIETTSNDEIHPYLIRYSISSVKIFCLEFINISSR